MALAKITRQGLISIAILVAIPALSLGRVLLADNTDPLGVRVVECAEPLRVRDDPREEFAAGLGVAGDRHETLPHRVVIFRR